MEYVEHADPRPEPISIARCRELLGEDAESMTDQDIEDIRRHAETMACIEIGSGLGSGCSTYSMGTPASSMQTFVMRWSALEARRHGVGAPKR